MVTCVVAWVHLDCLLPVWLIMEVSMTRSDIVGLGLKAVSAVRCVPRLMELANWAEYRPCFCLRLWSGNPLVQSLERSRRLLGAGHEAARHI